MGRKRKISSLDDVELLDESPFIDMKAAKAQHDEVQKQIANMEPEKREAIQSVIQEVDTAIAEMNTLVFSDAAFAADNRIAAAKRLEAFAQNKPVGQIFKYKDDLYVKTPFGQVAEAQKYVDLIQDNIIGVTNEVTRLNTELSKFTSLTFVDLIKLAFKRLFKGRD